MKKNFMLCALLVMACSLNAFGEDKKAPTADEQVAGLQKMCADSSQAIKDRQAKKSLYIRLGERPKIKSLFQNLFKTHMKNKAISHMFAHTNEDMFVRNATDFLVAGSGGKAKYRGKDMGAAHKNLHITNADFLAAGGDVQSVMKGMKYGENEIQEVVCTLVSFIPVVVVQK